MPTTTSSHIPADSAAHIDAFANALWLEDGLAENSLAAYRRDLRLYMSLDQGQSWREIIQLQPGYAAYSSMQRLPDGDLAIIFEDGSLGNQDKMDCYAINYVVLSRELINSFAESPDAISGSAVTVTGNKSAEIYDLSGQRLNTPPDGGIYIRNGRKVFAPQR